MERILNALKREKTDDFRIVETTSVSHQAFFIRQEMDQHRICRTRECELTVYVDQDGKRGQARQQIHPDASEEEIVSIIRDLKFNASLAPNPYFELPSHTSYKEERKEPDLMAAFSRIVKAMQEIENEGNEAINSYEVFVNHEYVHVVNSREVDASYNHSSAMIEVVIDSSSKERETEVYKMIRCGIDEDPENIKRKIREVFHTAADKSRAVTTPMLKNAHVLIRGEDLAEFFHYFLSKSSTSSIYSQISQVKKGDVCQKGDGDKVTLKVKADLKGSSNNIRFSSEGVLSKDYTLVDEGVYVNLNGDSRTAYYLGEKDVAPAFNYIVMPGSKKTEEMKTGSWLEAVQFSNFQMNPMTGDFGGELRLAYWHDGEKTIPVTAGSITCNMNRVLDNMYMSRELQQVDNCVIPLEIELFDINVAGEEK